MPVTSIIILKRCIWLPLIHIIKQRKPTCLKEPAALDIIACKWLPHIYRLTASCLRGQDKLCRCMWMPTSCRFCFNRATSMFKCLLFVPAVTCSPIASSVAEWFVECLFVNISDPEALTSSFPPPAAKPGGSCTLLPSIRLLPSSKCNVHLRNSAILSLWHWCNNMFCRTQENSFNLRIRFPSMR